MDRLDALKSFVQVVESQGFAAAGRQMGLSRSVVNKHVQRLEDELGAQLLRRSTRSVTLTSTGEGFYRHAVRLLADYDDAVNAVRELQDEPTGDLRINAPMSFGTLHLSALVAQFCAEHPRLRVELVLNDRFVDPLEEGFDVTLRIGEMPVSTSLVVQEIAPSKVVVCASPAYLHKYGEPSGPQALKNHRCLHYGYQASGSSWRLLVGGTIQSVPINCVMWSNNGQVLRDAAIAGNGIVLLPTFIVGDALQNGQLRTVLVGTPPVSTSLLALYPRHRHLSSKVRLFVQLLSARFAQQPYWDLIS
ncbi:MAG: LysR family transcriptional regulator [bacterium]